MIEGLILPSEICQFTSQIPASPRHELADSACYNLQLDCYLVLYRPKLAMWLYMHRTSLKLASFRLECRLRWRRTLESELAGW